MLVYIQQNRMATALLVHKKIAIIAKANTYNRRWRPGTKRDTSLSILIGQRCTRRYSAPKSNGALKERLTAVKETTLGPYLCLHEACNLQ